MGSFSKYVLKVALFFVVISFADAEGYYRAPESIFPRDGLEQRIQFWKDAFTKYGKDELIFHYRDYPWIIYSVLDLSPYSERYTGSELKTARERAVTYETKRIEDALMALSNGESPQNDLERHIVQMFSSLPGGRNKYLLALGENQVRNQSGVKELFAEGIKRSGRYLYAIETIFAREGLPVELSRLPLVESSFNYNAYSSVGAAGIWQFMKASGNRYMIINSAIDERRDPLASTRAAAQYLKHSYEVLGSWPVSITSYNHGLNGMVRAVKETGSNNMASVIKRYIGDSFGFASQNFYCEFIAALEVEKNYRFYFPGIEKENPWYVEEIRLERAHRLPELLALTGLSKEEFLSYNLALLDPIGKNRASVPGGFLIKVPRGSGSMAVARRSSNLKKESNSPVKEPNVSESVRFDGEYVVRKGDSIFSIAKKYKTSGAKLMAANELSSAKALRVGRRLQVPRVEAADQTARARLGGSTENRDKVAPQKSELPKADQPLASKNTASKSYVVKKGDTISSISKQNGITKQKLLQLNNLKEPKIKAGQSLKLE